MRELLTSPLAGLGFLARAWAAIPVVELSLRVLGYKRTMTWIEAVPKARATAGGSSVRLGQRLVRGAYRAHVFRGGCLPTSLVQYLLHRRDGTSARFVIGVHRVPPPQRRAPNEMQRPGIEAHAWVEAPDLAPVVQKFAPIFHSEGAG